MRKIAYILAFFISVNMLMINVYAFVDTTKEEKSSGEELFVTTFNNYEPFGKLEPGEDMSAIDSIFISELVKFAQNKNYVLRAEGGKSNHITNVRAVRSGKIHLLIGAYSLTKMYSGIELVYPAMITNPVSVAMMPDKIDQIKTVEDLRDLKGIRIKDENFNDYVEGILKKFKVETVDNAYAAYEKLFIGDVDYIIGGYYYLVSESIKIGVRNYVSFSRKPLWEIPVFIGVSRTAKVNHKLLIKFLTAWSNTPSVKENIKQNLRDYMDKLEEQYSGVVPPMFIRHDDAPTPAGNVFNPQAELENSQSETQETELSAAEATEEEEELSDEEQAAAKRAENAKKTISQLETPETTLIKYEGNEAKIEWLDNTNALEAKKETVEQKKEETPETKKNVFEIKDEAKTEEPQEKQAEDKQEEKPQEEKVKTEVAEQVKAAEPAEAKTEVAEVKATEPAEAKTEVAEVKATEPVEVKKEEKEPEKQQDEDSQSPAVSAEASQTTEAQTNAPQAAAPQTNVPQVTEPQTNTTQTTEAQTNTPQATEVSSETSQTAETNEKNEEKQEVTEQKQEETPEKEETKEALPEQTEDKE